MGHRRSVDRSASALEGDVDAAQAGGPHDVAGQVGDVLEDPTQAIEGADDRAIVGYRFNTADGCARRQPGRMPTPMLSHMSSHDDGGTSLGAGRRGRGPGPT
jgi:hypothetical protein